MKVIFDIECNGLYNPTEVWLIICKDLTTCHSHVFRHLTSDAGERARFLEFALQVELWIGHNILKYDLPVLEKLLGLVVPVEKCLDTFILSKLIDYPRKKHSVEHYGEEFSLPKGDVSDFSQYSQSMEDYCIRDVDICHRIYGKYSKYVKGPEHLSSIVREHRFQLVVNKLHHNGFALDIEETTRILEEVTAELAVLDKKILDAFPPRLKLIREIIPKETKYGSISLSSIPKGLRNSIHEYSVGAPFCYCGWVSFNPASHKQIVSVLNEAGWSPISKTDTHVDTERELNKLRRVRKRSSQLDLELKACEDKILKLAIYGWKVNENNLSTLPSSAPAPARLLSRRILYEARRRTLTEMLGLVCSKIEINKESTQEAGLVATKIELESITSNTNISSPPKTLIEWLKSRGVNAEFVEENANSILIIVTGKERLGACCAVLATGVSVGLKQIPIKYKVISNRIHGEFQGIGAWTHRMSHQKPNMANVTNAVRVSDGKPSLLGKEIRQCWIAPKGRLLVGVDAEAIQLRVFAHMINDPVLIDAIVNGNKKDGTDPHSLNKVYFGSFCKTRQAAKHALYAMFFGGTASMLSHIMGCSRAEAQQAIDSLIEKYPGLRRLQQEVFPIDARRGYFIGLDGRKVRIPGETVKDREHLCMSGYLQNGEKVIMAEATIKFEPELVHYDSFLVNLVHDEWQNEGPDDFDTCVSVAQLECKALVDVGVELNLNCPLAGSYTNDEGKYTFGRTWYETH